MVALKAIIQIVVYTIIALIIFMILVDGVFNDLIAEKIYESDTMSYYIIVKNKQIIIASIYSVFVILVAFFVIRNASNHLITITMAMNQISKNPDKEVTLPPYLAVIENKLNNIRIELIKNRNEAKEEEAKKNDLIMYMAHDLKTPLTSIIGYLTLLTEEKQISKPLEEKYIKIALEKALRVEELTNQFFEITRYNLHDMPIQKEKNDLSFLLEQLVDECYPMLQERKLTCEVTKPDHVYYEGDGDKLARAFGNLIKNAIHYSYENTLIEIVLEEKEETIQVIFRNRGDKIPEYKLEKLFDKFYRIDEARASNEGGAGLGLAITKEIIQLHKGDISVKNEDDVIEFSITL